MTRMTPPWTLRYVHFATVNNNNNNNNNNNTARYNPLTLAIESPPMARYIHFHLHDNPHPRTTRHRSNPPISRPNINPHRLIRRGRQLQTCITNSHHHKTLPLKTLTSSPQPPKTPPSRRRSLPLATTTLQPALSNPPRPHPSLPRYFRISSNSPSLRPR